MTPVESVASDRVVIVTGTSTGIGLETAVLLASSGWRVIATMRNLAKSDALRQHAEAAGVDLDVRHLDVVSDESVAACVDSVVADFGRIDAVVNNAGAGHIGTLEQEDLAAFVEVIDTNLISVARMTKAVLPHLRASRGHVLTVTSVGGVVGQPFNEAYCAAKFGVEGMLESLAPVARTVGVRVTVVEPGPVATEFVANVGSAHSTTVQDPGAYGPALAGYAARVSGAFANAQSAADVAQVIARVLDDPDPAFRHQTSDGSKAFVSTKISDVDGSAVQTLTRSWLD